MLVRAKIRLKGRWGVIFFCLIFCSCNTDLQDEDPNIILILADDLGWTQLGCYGGAYETPYIDRLARDGMRFTRAYAAAAVCSPTRAALMTGKYPARLHLTDFIKGQDFPDSLLKQPDWQKHLSLEEVTIGEMLKEQGYRTACFGKWHLSQDKTPPKSEPFNPDKQGFDEYMVTYKPNRSLTDPEHDPHNVDSITNRAIRFLEENVHSKFFLYVAHNSIHDPVMESRERISDFEQDTTLENDKIWPVLAAMVNRLDDGVGKILNAVDDLGLRNNTLVVFYSDNGGRDIYAKQGPLRKGKGWLYEGGIRVPLIVRWPGQVTPGSSSEHMISSIDFLPTLRELSGRTQPLLVDGISFLPQCYGEEPVTHRTLFWHYPHYHGGSGMKPAGAIIQGEYKLIEWYEKSLTNQAGAFELYNLKNDLSERNNLLDAQPEKAEELKQGLAEWRSEIGAQMPSIRN